MKRIMISGPQTKRVAALGSEARAGDELRDDADRPAQPVAGRVDGHLDVDRRRATPRARSA